MSKLMGTASSLNEPVRIWTVGHSTLPAEKFIELLRSHEILNLADVRRYPASRRYPHFNAETLHETLAASGIAYHSFSDLGGRRTPQPDSHNTAWRNEAFRGYADFMETGEFSRGVARLLQLAQSGRTAIMCAESVWWRCHRAVLADYLKTTGVDVCHIMGPGKCTLHPFTRAARIVEGKLSYRKED